MSRTVQIIALICLAILVGVGFWLYKKKAAKAKVGVLGAHHPTVASEIAIWAYGDAKTVELLKQKVEEMQRVITNKINLRIFPSRRDLISSLENGIAREKVPDVFLAELQDFAPFYSAGLMKPLSLKDHGAYEWIPDIFNAYIRNDALVAFPSEYSLLVLYYNRRHFDRIGIAYPDTHWTWQTLVDVARALYRGDDHPKGMAYALEQKLDFEWWNALANQVDDGLYRGADWLWGVPQNTTSIIESLRYMIDLHKTYSFCAPAFAGKNPPNFMQGMASMCFAGTGLRIELQKDPEFMWGVTMVPRKNGYATPLTTRGWGIMAATQAPKESIAIAEALSHFVAEGWMPARANQLQETTSDYNTVFQVSLRYAKAPYMHPENEKVRQIVNSALARIQESGPVTAEEIISEVESGVSFLNLPGPPMPSPETVRLLRPQ